MTASDLPSGETFRIGDAEDLARPCEVEDFAGGGRDRQARWGRSRWGDSDRTGLR